MMRRLLASLLLLMQALAWTPSSAFTSQQTRNIHVVPRSPSRNHDRIGRFIKAPSTLSSTTRIATPSDVFQLREDSGVDDNDDNANASPFQAHLVFPGGGIFFYWQAGAITHLRESGYDLSNVSMSGASAGALSATLATAGVCFEEATNLALDLAEEAGVWDRKEGLQGIWGPLIERWLDELLPDDAHEVASDRLSLLVTPVPSFGKTRVTQFTNKQDLIECNMASVHLPWFLDGQLTSDFRNSRHIDGSFLAKPTDYVPPDLEQRSVIRLDWTEDPDMGKEIGDFVKLVSKEGIWGMVDQGRSYAAEVMEKRGDFVELPRL